LRRLGRWQVDPALAGLRELQAVAGLPEAERHSLRELWRRINELRSTAAIPAQQKRDASKIRRRRL
jgi:hypothetical protein